MNRGYLKGYFIGVAAKRLSEVEANAEVSHQHELNGAEPLRAILGEAKRYFEAVFLHLSDDEEATISSSAKVTWYDSREKQPKRKAEYRLYYAANEVMARAHAGDLVIVGEKRDGRLFVIICAARSTIESQLIWLFGFPLLREGEFEAQSSPALPGGNLQFVSDSILETVGLLPAQPAPKDDLLKALSAAFPHGFPSTDAVSAFARASAPMSREADADSLLLTWTDCEDRIFRMLEEREIGERITQGFASVDTFIAFSLSVQNRRKSRAGHSLEHHLEALFKRYSLRYVRGATTEPNSKPDFLFPGLKEYQQPDFPVDSLIVLAAKRSCKERWRQVLAEARRIHRKHLATLEAAISTEQTEDMNLQGVQLVLPGPLLETYDPKQRDGIMTITGFIELVRSVQRTG